jgi:two-component system, chemotaxis family, chemotaxis protein CheY
MTEILLVDESRAERHDLARLLGGHGLEIIEVEGAEEALRRCAHRAPDAVIVTERIGIPPADFVKKVRRNARGRRPLVLLYTDRPDTDAIGRAIMEGAAECLIKPLDPELLRFKLTQIGLLRAAERALARAV